jgi:predicted dehydrogenase
MLNFLPQLPRRKDWPIGCIGCGFIMTDCHLTAYRQAGFHPIAIASRNHAHAQAVADVHRLPRCHATIETLLDDRDIQVLDVAVPPDVQPEILLRALERQHIKAILAQKPLAMSLAEAKRIVNACEKANVLLAVNQNMRYDQSVRAMKSLLNRGDLGDPVLASIDMRAIPHWMPWALGQRSLATFIMSIHHLDTFRYWFGTPDRVLASTRRDPRTKFEHRDGINLYILEYDGGLRATSWDDVWAGPVKEGAGQDIGIRWRVEGTQGLARGTIGWPSYPTPTPSTLDFTTIAHKGRWEQPRWTEVWFPDAFVGTMAQLLVALETGSEPEISGRDNLQTLALCEAVLASATEHRVCTVREFLDS